MTMKETTITKIQVLLVVFMVCFVIFSINEREYFLKVLPVGTLEEDIFEPKENIKLGFFTQYTNEGEWYY